MKDLFKCIKLIKFGLQLKLMVILSFMFLALGILFEMTGSSMSNLGPLYIVLSGLYVSQLVFSPSISKLVQVSPYKKKIQTFGMASITCISALLSFSILVVLRLINGNPEKLADNEIPVSEHYSGLLYATVILFILLIYMAICFKYYIVSMIICIAGVLGFFAISNTTGKNPFMAVTESLMNGDSPVLLIVVCYAIILLGGLLCYIFSCLLYRKEISQLAIRNAMRQAQAK